MEFINADVKPGVVIEVDDPEKLGRIKACSPAEFSPDMKVDLLPWIYPAGMTHYNSFTKMVKGGKVWIIHDRNTHNNYHYIPQFEEISIVKSFLQDKYDKDPEVVFARDNGGNTTIIRYDSDDGINMIVKDTFTNIRPDKEIINHVPDVNLDLRGSQVWSGKTDQPFEPAVFGQTLVDLLKGLYDGFTKMQSGCSSPWNPTLLPGITTCIATLTNAERILTKNTMVN